MRKAFFVTCIIIVCLFVSVSSLMAFGQKDETAANEGNETAKRFRNIGMMYLGAQEIADFEVTKRNGETLKLSDLKGKIVFLNFWATWCPPCQAEMPSIERLYKQFKDTDLEILAVSIGENAETVNDFLTQTPYSFPIALNPDGRLGALYARSIPSTYIINKDGTVIAAKIGAQEWDTEKIISVFTQLLKEEM
jgi:thiol-disulfide isomerase/thioredoxin